MQLREYNDLNWERVKAAMDARFAGLDARFAAIDARFEVAESRYAEMLAKQGAETKGELMRWMFIYWTGTIIPLGGLIIALTRK